MSKRHHATKRPHPQPKGTIMNAPHLDPAETQPESAPAAAPAAPLALSPDLAQQIAALTAHTLAAALPATLEAMGIKAAPAAQAAPATLRPQDNPDFEEGPPSARFEVSTTLLARHFEWMERRAAATGRSVSQSLEDLVRLAYAADPTKGGAIAVALPSQLGQGAASAPRVAG